MVAAPSRLQQEIARSILCALRDEGVQPGYPLVEEQLSRRFKVSRTPVRGALKLLAAQGLVEWRNGRGYQLAESALKAEISGATLEQKEDEKLLHAILEACERGALPETLTLDKVARVMHAGRSAVVRVLSQMVALHLLEKKPGKGWLFRDHEQARDPLADSYAFRRAIEPAALRSPHFQFDLQWAARMRERHEQTRALLAQGRYDPAFNDLNNEFHEHIARMSGNAYMLTALRHHLRYVRVLPQQMQRLADAVEDHLGILDALERGDNGHAATLMLAHLDHHDESGGRHVASQ